MKDITHLAGIVFSKRGAKDGDLDELIKSAPYGDLTLEQEATFRAVMVNPNLRPLIDEWWKTYDIEREAGNVPKASPWWD